MCGAEQCRRSRSLSLELVGSADAVLFLSSPAAQFITGTTLTTDGGNFLKPLPELL